MSAVLRIPFLKFVCPKSQFNAHVKNISSKAAKLPPSTPKPAPWPYEFKRYNFFHSLYDKTTSRFDENSKIIVVEGPVAAGKSKFAKHLAAELDMLYLPEANQDMLYINAYGFDLKTLDDQIPESLRSFDVADWLKNPSYYKAGSFQIQQYIMRYSQYIDALAHVFSTGQGVVLDRCAFSDFVFLEAMYSQKFISKKVRNKYYEFRKSSIDELHRPHLVIYLDVPVNKTIDNIKKRNILIETQSPAMNKKYLTDMEHFYKQKYLKEISVHSELLVYDWSEEGEPDVVVEDIERIDFDKYKSDEKKLKDWEHNHEEEWAVLRNLYTDKKDFLMCYLNVPCNDVDELLASGEDFHEYMRVMDSAPGTKFSEGFNADMGDKGILFKNYVKPRETLPRIERRFP